jgi:glycosyltransferase involved in cell wall biosynthesis
MRVLLLTQYFDPESTYKGMIYARELIRQGHQVEILTGFPNYPGGKLFPGYRVRLLQIEIMEGIKVIRVPLYPSHGAGGLGRILNYLSFSFSAAAIGPWVVTRPDVIHVYHGHATIGLPAWVISRTRRVPFVLDIQDLWPDTIVASGMLPGWMRPLIPILNGWCNFMYRRAARIAVQSKGFKTTLMSRGVSEAKIEVIPNWCDPVTVRSSDLDPREDALLHGRFNIVMAGNMGVMQSLDVVLDAAVELAHRVPCAQFVLVGAGVDRSRLEKRTVALGLRNVLFLPKRPPSQIGGLLHRADALLVHLKEDPLFAITIPSRIQAYLAVGRPILCGVRGDGSDLVKEAGGGICFEPDNPKSLADAVEQLCLLTPEAFQDMAEHGRRFYQERLALPVGSKSFIFAFQRALTS